MSEALTGKFEDLQKKYGNAPRWMADLSAGTQRAAALTGRNILQGASNVITAVPDLAQQAYNLYAPRSWQGDIAGQHFGKNPLPSELVNEALNKVAPQPQNAFERYGGALEQGLTGIGGNAYGLIKGGQQLAEAAPGSLKKALERLENRLSRDATSFDVASRNVAAANEQGIPLRLTEAGINTQRTGEVLANKPGESQSIIVNDRNAIRADTKERVPDEVRTALSSQGDIGSAEHALMATRSTSAKANYAAVKADTTPVQDAQIDRLLQDPTISKLYQEARARHMTERGINAVAGVNDPPLQELYVPRSGTPTMPGRSPAPGYSPSDWNAMNAGRPTTPNPGDPMTADWMRSTAQPDVRSLDYLQRSMDKRITALYQDPEQQGTAKSLQNARGVLIDRLKDISPAFKTASETYGSDSEVLEALQRGKGSSISTASGLVKPSFLTLSPQDARRYVDSLSESGKAALRMGVADKLLKQHEMSGRNTDIATDVLGGPRKQLLLNSLFDGDESKYDAFVQAMKLEGKIHQAGSQILRGSQTMGRFAAEADFNDTGRETVGKVLTIASQLSHRWRGAAAHGILRLMGSTWNKDVAAQASRILSSPDPIAAVKRLQALEDYAAARQKPSEAAAAYATQFGAGAGLAGSDQDKQRLQDKYGIQP